MSEPLALLPHRPPLRLVEGIALPPANGTEPAEKHREIVARGGFDPVFPFVLDGEVPVLWALEFAAQATILLSAPCDQATATEQARPVGGPAIGYLVHLRNVECMRPTVPHDAKLLAAVTQKGRMGPMALFSVRVWIEGPTPDEADGEIVLTGQLGTHAGP